MFITEGFSGSISLLESDLCWQKLEAEIISFLDMIYNLFIMQNEIINKSLDRHSISVHCTFK